MADELDVFAGAMPAKSAGGAQPQQQQPKPAAKKFFGGRKPFQRHAQGKQNNSPIRGSNGEESVGRFFRTACCHGTANTVTAFFLLFVNVITGTGYHKDQYHGNCYICDQ